MTQKSTISLDIFLSLDVRACRVLEVEPILKNSKKELSLDNPVKAYKFLLDTGFDQRSCVTNLVMLNPDVFLGKVFPFVLNLPETTIRGVLSKAMIIAAGTEPPGIIALDDCLFGSSLI